MVRRAVDGRRRHPHPEDAVLHALDAFDPDRGVSRTANRTSGKVKHQKARRTTRTIIGERSMAHLGRGSARRTDAEDRLGRRDETSREDGRADRPTTGRPAAHRVYGGR